MKKQLLSLCLLIFAAVFSVKAQTTTEQFWKQLTAMCGNAYEGTVTEGASNDTFRDKRLVMHVRACNDSTIRIPFFVGDDKSRTWVLTRSQGRITLKHDHRHEDGSEDKVTQYGGTATNTGSATLQLFPANQYTCTLLPAAFGNVWWITVDEKIFTYNLRRIGSDRLFTASFDLSKKVEAPGAPWGWKD